MAERTPSTMYASPVGVFGLLTNLLASEYKCTRTPHLVPAQGICSSIINRQKVHSHSEKSQYFGRAKLYTIQILIALVCIGEIVERIE